MKSATKPKKQAETDNGAEPQRKEREGLTLAEKTAVEHFHTDTTRRTMEPELMVFEIRSIIGANDPVEARTPTRPSDQLARLLATVRFDESSLSEKSRLSLDESIECCFLHSDVYKLALEIYRLDLAGEIVGYSSAYQAIEDALKLAKGGKQA